MTLSPIQHDYVTKKEFYDFKSYVKDGFEMTNKHIDNLEIHMNERFTKLENNIDVKFKKIDDKFISIDNKFVSIDKRFESIDKRFVSIDKQLTGINDNLFSLNKVVNKIAAKIL